MTTRTSHLSDLNEAQLRAVKHGYGPLLIFAGAGSGKTRVLTRRIANLIFEHGVSPAQILAVTFTNKAAREMKQRVEALFPGRSLPIWVSTFHSSCARILRQHARALDYTDRFAIYDTQDSLGALKRVYKKVDIDPKVVDPRMVMRYMDRAKNDYRFADSIRNDPYIGREVGEYVAQLFDAYQEELRSANAMDFGDLLCNVVTLFKLEPSILESYQQRFKFLLIDEYQDTNKVQYLLMRQLTGASQNICVVGDDDQSIYGFRGATVETILNFKNDFPDAEVITLDTNYRSTKNILSAAHAVICKNERRHPKQMNTENPVGDVISCFKAFDEKDEAEFVIRELSKLFHEGLTPEETAIFYRTNAQSRAIEEALIESGIPYQIFGGHRFYDRKEVKDIVAYYRLILNPRDNEAFLRVVNTPARGIGATALAALSSFADKEGLSLFQAAEKVGAGEGPFTKAQAAKFQAFFELINALMKGAEQASLTLLGEGFTPGEQSQAIAELLKAIADQSGYMKALVAQDSIESESRIENINELCRVAVDFVERCLEQGVAPTLFDFLDRASLSSDLEQENSAVSGDGSRLNGFVSLMTLHLAKGLEFDTAFLIGLEEGLLPHTRSIDDREALEEERRLCYVGMTRAKRRLFLTRATDRQSFGRGNWYSGLPSRFLDDLPVDVMDDFRSGFLQF